jgi:membrane associated rhomboid family serine protease
MVRRRPTAPPVSNAQEQPAAQEMPSIPKIPAMPEAPPTPEAEPITAQPITQPAAEQTTAIQPAEEEIEPTEIRISEGGYKQIRDESLVLLSQGITHRLEHSPDGPFQIFVDLDDQKRARFQIRLYHRENPPREVNEPLPLKASLQPIWVLLVPAAVTLVQFSGIVPGIEGEGLSDAEKVLNGQWWRCITALTLHGDSRHLGGNLLTGYLVLSMMSYRISLAKVVPFLAVSSALANFCVAATVHSDFRSLGFSTFVFAAIGALSVMEFRLMPKESHGLLRRFAPLCGAASLATFVGIGEHADILAHLYGFIAGLLCGFIPNKKSLRWGAPVVASDIFWIVGYYAIFVIGWAFAHG